MSTTFSGETLQTPEEVAVQEALADEVYILQWVVDGYLANDTVVDASTVNLILEELRRKHVDDSEFRLSSDAMKRHAILAGNSYAVATVLLPAIGDKPIEGVLDTEPASARSELVQVVTPLMGRILSFLRTGDNLSDEDWVAVEHPDQYEEVVALCQRLYLDIKDPAALTRLQLVASTIKLVLHKKPVEPVAHIRDGSMRGSRAKK